MTQTFTQKVKTFLSSPKINKVVNICNEVLDIVASIGTATHPIAYVAAAGSVFGILRETITGDSGEIDTYIENCGLKDLHTDLGELLFNSGLIQMFKAKMIMSNEYTELYEINIDEDVLYFKKQKQWVDVSVYCYEGKESALIKLIQKLYRMIGGMGIEIAASGMDGQQLSIHQVPFLFTDQPLDKLLDLADQIHKEKKRGDSPAFIYFGMAGTGKSTTALSLAQLMGFRVIMLGPQAIEKIGTKSMNDIVDSFMPGMLVLDDIDKVDKLNMFLTTLNHIRAKHPKMTVILTANDLSELGPALLRPGRSGEAIEFKPPNLEERMEILVGSGCPSIFDTKNLAKEFVGDITHDWVRHAGRKLQECETEEEAIELINNVNFRFRLANGEDEEDEND